MCDAVPCSLRSVCPPFPPPGFFPHIFCPSLHLFLLANNNVIINNTKAKLEEIKAFKDVLVYITHTCLDRFEQGDFVTPEEKHTLLKVCHLIAL